MGGFRSVLGAQQLDIGVDLGIVGVPRQIVVHARARIREQHLLDERDGGGGAFDVQQDGSNVCQRAIGMYVGPQHTG